VLTSAVELVLETGYDVERASVVDEGTAVAGTMEEEYNVIVDVELTYSVVVEYSVTVVHVVGDCAAVRRIHAPKPSKIALFMIDIRCEAGCTRTL